MFSKFLLLFFVFSYLFVSDQSFNQDLGRHLKLGEIIFNNVAVPKVNLFSYTNPNFPFINTHWLFEVFVYLGSLDFGLQTLLIFKIVIFLTSVWIILKLVPKQNSEFLLLFGFIFLHVLRERLDLRPEIFSFLFTSITLYILQNFITQKQKPPIFLLPIVQLIWINTHIYFFVGLVLQAIFLLHSVFQHFRLNLEGSNVKLLGIIFILSAGISLINPNGFEGFIYPLKVNSNYGYTIVENQTMFFLENIKFSDPNYLFVKISLGIAAISVAISALRRQFNLLSFLLISFGCSLALLNVRSFPYLVFLSLPATLQNFGSIKLPKLIIYLLSTITILALILESFFYLSGTYYRSKDHYNYPIIEFSENGKEALNFVLNNNLPAPIFNNFDIGSYLIYRGYPKYKVFVDGRPEAYPSQFFTGIYIPSQGDYKNFKEVEKLYGFKTIIFSHTDQTPWADNFIKNVLKNRGWRLVFLDDFMMILIREDLNLPLEKIDLFKLNAKEYNFKNHVSYLRLGLFLLKTENPNASVSFFEKAYQIAPESPIANSFMYNLTGQNKFSNKSQNNIFW